MRIKDFDPANPGTSQMYDQRSITDEVELETWLHHNPDLLLDENLLLIGRQFSVRTGTPDLLGLDKYGNVIVFELKVGKSGSDSASEKSILGQPQSYARAISSLDYDDLATAFAEYREELELDKWDATPPEESSDSLEEAFEERFGRSISRDQFNTHQRMVIVAEEITETTAGNSRHLVDEGLPLQCVEVEFCVLSADTTDTLLAAETVVDYPLRRVKPDRESREEFEVLLIGLRDSIREQLDSLLESAPLDHVTTSPRSQLEFIDETVFVDLKIAYTIKPYSEGHVTLSLKLYDYGDSDEEKNQVKRILREETDIQHDETLSFDPASSTIVQKRLPLRTDDGEVTADSTTEIENEFIDLVSELHPVIIDATTQEIS